MVIYEVDEALAPNANRGLDVCTMSMTEFVTNMTRRAAEPATCRTLKIAQAGEPPAGYLSTTAGVMVWATPCRTILLGMPMLNSETTTQAVYGLLRILTKAPDIKERLEGVCMDNACGLERHVAAKVRGRVRSNVHIDSPRKGDSRANFCTCLSHASLPSPPPSPQAKTTAEG